MDNRMKMQLLPELSIRAVLTNLLNVLVERIIDISDYLCEIKRITLSEWCAFIANAGFAFVFAAYQVKSSSPTYEYIGSEKLWTFVFVALFAVHLLGFYKNWVKLRYYITVGYSMNWFIWTVIAWYGNAASPMWAMCFAQLLTSIVLAVRLNDESNSYYVS